MFVLENGVSREVFAPGHYSQLAPMTIIGGRLFLVSPDLNDRNIIHVDLVPEFVPVDGSVVVTDPIPVSGSGADAEAREAIKRIAGDINRLNGQVAAVDGSSHRTRLLTEQLDAVVTDHDRALKNMRSAVVDLQKSFVGIPTEGRIHDIAAAQAWSVLKTWWNKNADYERREFFNLIHNRIARFMSSHELWRPMNPDKPIPVNKPESIKIND